MGQIPNEVKVMSQKAEIIAMAGKGGTGKTTLAGVITRFMRERGLTPVLVVDADANANLNEVLGVEVETTLGEIRDRMKHETPPGMTKNEFMEMHINQAIIEETGFDLVVMGQPEGPGCYCMANSILSQVIERLSQNYRYLLVDNEAGMEHLSRLNLRHIKSLFVVSDPSSRGVLTAARIADLTRSLGVEVGKKVLIVNRCPAEIPQQLREQVEEAAAKTDLVFGGYLPASEQVFQCEVEQRSIFTVPADDPFITQAYSIIENYL